jgi:Zn-dependent protease with chaperone function
LIIPDTPPDASLIARLEKAASENSGRYRLRLAILAIVGDVLLTFLLVLPLALPIALGALWLNHPIYYGVAAVAILFIAWLMRPTLRIKGRLLSADEAPELYRQLTQLRQKLQVSGRMQVMLDDSFGASAIESRGIFGLFGIRSVLMLGVPMLAVLDRQQVLAIIAHEFGHFSRRHGRMGHWLYRARVGWLEFAQHVGDSDLVIDKAAIGYARWFVPFFSVRCFVHSRRCEYEADSDAALAAGNGPLAQALTRIAVLSHLWDRGLSRFIRSWQRASAEPPANFHERFAELAQSQSPSQLNAWLNEALAERVSWIDTHPTLAERLAAIAQPPDLAMTGSSAGAELLGTQWPAILAEFDSQWVQAVRSEWTFEHLSFKYIFGPLFDIDDGAAAQLTDDKQLLRARALRLVEPAKGLAALEALHARHPSNLTITFFYGAALLAENDVRGVALLESLAKQDITLLYAIYERLYVYCRRSGRGFERWESLLNRAALREAEASGVFFDDAVAGRARVCSLSPEVRKAIAEATHLDPYVTDAWLMEGDCRIEVPSRGAATVVVRALILTVNPAGLPPGVHSTDVAARYTKSLAAVIAPQDIPVVRAYFTTEPIPPVFHRGSQYSLSM